MRKMKWIATALVIALLSEDRRNNVLQAVALLGALRQLAEALEVTLDDLVNMPENEVCDRPDMRKKHLFGLVTVGDKGQIVIPARARKVFNIKSGDQMMVLGDEDQGIALVNASLFMDAAEVIKNGR